MMTINDTPDICKERALLQKQQEADWQKLKALMDNLAEIILKPCPLCGLQVELHDHGEGTGGWMVACNCGLMKVRSTGWETVLPSYEDCKKQVVVEWNSREAAQAAGGES